MITKFLIYFTNKLPYLVFYLTFFYVSCTFVNAQDYINQQLIKKVVIDAGHGGRDPGSVGKKSREKNITLSVALKLGELINKKFPNVEVIYTRNKDVFVDLDERGNIANRNNADLFISIHVNSFTRSSPRGVSTWVMGMHKSTANLEVSKRENSVITMENDYTSKYQGYNPNSPESYIMFTLLQNVHMNESLKFAELVQNDLLKTSPLKVDRGVQQAGFLVLWKTAMPSILIELGFISNAADEAIIMKTENQIKMAEAVFNAFSKYKQEYEGNTADIKQVSNNSKTTEAITDSEKTTTVDNMSQSKDNLPLSDKTESAAKSTEKTSSATNNEKTTTANANQKTYSVQIMAINKLISVNAKDFKGHKNIRYIKIGKHYKYLAGSFSDLNQALQLCRTLQKDFKGAFVVEVEENNLKPAR